MEMPMPQRLLQLARDKIEAGWIQGGFAENVEGVRCSARDSDATKFCAIGAMISAKLALQADEQEYALARVEIFKRIPPDKFLNLTTWNDNSTKEEVLAVFNTAIQEYGVEDAAQ